MELICPAGNLPALKKAVDAGANAVYLGLKDNTNARHFAGLNFSEDQIVQGIRYAHSHQCQVLMAINTYAQGERAPAWYRAVDQAAKLGADAIIAADIGVLDYAQRHHPELNRHLSVQASATSAASINWYVKEFAIKRVVLPRVLSASQVEQLAGAVDCELEVFAFGSLCIMAEGRCYMSSYLTGESPNTVGACSPANYVRWQEDASGLKAYLNGQLIDSYNANEQAGYPTLCKGRFHTDQESARYVFEEPTSLNSYEVLLRLQQAGVKAVKIEGRQRSPAYISKVTRVWRQLLNQVREGKPADATVAHQLDSVSEAQQTTLGAYERSWQ